MNKKIVYSNNARKALVQGMKILAKVVGLTLGPKGKNVVLSNSSGMPRAIDDGVTIAREVHLVNRLEDIGASLLRQAVVKTEDVAGDGTTTTTILAYTMIREGVKIIEAGLNPALIRDGINQAAHFLIDKILEYSCPVESINDVAAVASISLGNDMYMGSIIGEAINRIGREGVISLEEGNRSYTSLDFLEGMVIEKGLASSHFFTSSSETEISQNDPLILLVDEDIISIQDDFIRVLEEASSMQRSLLIIAKDFSKEVLSMLTVNRLNGIIDVIAVRSVELGSTRSLLLEDLAILVGGQVISQNSSLTLGILSLNFAGSARRVVASKNMTKIFVEGHNQKICSRCNYIRKQIELSASLYEKQNLQKRLRRLALTAVIQVGAPTEAELCRKKLCLEDAVNTAQAAIDEGVIPGGGTTFLHLIDDLEVWMDQALCVQEELIGARIMSRALLAPLAIILENNGVVIPQLIIERIKAADFSIGYDASTSTLVNMHKSGVIDSAKVLRLVVQNAASIASIALTTECIVDSYFTE